MRPQLSGLLLLGVLGLSLALALPSANAASTTIVPRVTAPQGVPIVNGYASGIVTPLTSMSMQAYATCADQPKPSNVMGFPCFNGSGNDTIYFNVSGFENIQVSYLFKVQTFTNATGTHILVLRFPGTQPYKIAGTTISSQTYDFTKRWEQVIFTSSSTDLAFQVVYLGVSTAIDNAITVGVGLFTINLSLIMIGFILMVMGRFWTKDEEQEGVNRVTYYGFGIIIAAVLALGTLAIIGAFDPFFRALGI